MKRTVISVALAAGWAVASFAQQDVAQTATIVDITHVVVDRRVAER